MQSVVSYPERGEGGSSSYRGNCSPRLIEDIISQYKLRSLSDFMVGGGTTKDVCLRLGVEGTYDDLRYGGNMLLPTYEIKDRPDNIFWHPPYGNFKNMPKYAGVMWDAKEFQAKYGYDPRKYDLSWAEDWPDFVKKMNLCMLKQYASLRKGGRMFVLMGDAKSHGKLFSMLADIVKPGTLEQIIIKMQHNCVSDNREYSNRNFVPIVHEYLMVVRKDESLLIPVSLPKMTEFDMRDRPTTTWRDVVASIMEDAGEPLSLSEIYSAVEGHKKCEYNKDWQAKIRQTLQLWSGFEHVREGVWALRAGAHAA